MLAFLLGAFRLTWLFGNGHHAVVLENIALRQQLSVYKRKEKRRRLAGWDRWCWIGLSQVWKDWRRALVVVDPDTVVRWLKTKTNVIDQKITRLSVSTSLNFGFVRIRTK